MNIVKQNNEFRFFNEVEILRKLPKNTVYEIDYNPVAIWINGADNFVLPKKIYDIDGDFRKQVKKSYREIGGNLGVLLCGYKGQGKSMTAKQLCIEVGDPVIMITKKIPLKIDFAGFLSNIKQDVIIFIDEFEKLFEQKSYNQNQGTDEYHSQESFLTLTDGVYNSKYRRLFILTSNKEINDKFISRPTRIRYYKSYNSTEKVLYDMIIAETLKNKAHEADLRKNLPVVSSTVDLLKCVIEEINVHDRPYSSFMSFFNFRPVVFSYEKSQYDETRDTWIWKGSFDVTSEITQESTYVDGDHCRVTEVTAGYIYYYVSNTENSIRGRKKSITKYRLSKVPLYSVYKHSDLI